MSDGPAVVLRVSPQYPLKRRTKRKFHDKCENG